MSVFAAPTGRHRSSANLDFWRQIKEKGGKNLSEMKKNVTLHPQYIEQGRSPVGLERCSHIAEVIGSSPIVPTPTEEKSHGFSFFCYPGF